MSEKSQTNPNKPNVFWGFLLERAIMGSAVDAALDVAQVCALRSFTRLAVPYQRTDMARNRIVKSFLEVSKGPDDVVVMLDSDHYHPANIVSRLASYQHEVGVIGALYFRRGEPYDPLFYDRDVEGNLRNMAEWEEGLVYEGTAVATGAIAVKRWVFEELDKAGYPYPYFQYDYPPESDYSMTEDIFFALNCERAGITHFCDTGVTTPHLAVKAITKEDWLAYVKKNPQILVKPGLKEKKGD